MNKTITIKCPKDIYDEIIKCRHFPSTELIQPGDEVKFNDIYKVCPNCEELVDEEIKPNYLGEFYHGWCDKWVKPDVDTFGTYKATPIAVDVDFHQETLLKGMDVEETNRYEFSYLLKSTERAGMHSSIIGYEYITKKLYNWIKENFKGNFIMNRLEIKDEK